MTKYEALETVVISQGKETKIEIKTRSADCYLPWDVSEFAKNLAELTGKPVRVEIIQTVAVEPIQEEPTPETPSEVKT